VAGNHGGRSGWWNPGDAVILTNLKAVSCKICPVEPPRLRRYRFCLSLAHRIAQKVGVRFRKPLAQGNFGFPAHGCKSRNIKKLSRRTVWSGRIVFDVAPKSDDFRNGVSEFCNGHILAKTDIEKLRT
jgi:hypothetical protein